MKRFIILCIGILVLAGFLRLYRLQYGDPIGDEADYGFRSIGLLDYESNPFHSTPLEWYAPGKPPLWLKLSFHDAPPLFFLVQHLSFRTFGTNTVGLRFPSAVFGIGTVLLTIILATLLYNRPTGILAGMFIALSSNAIYVSRVGHLSSMTIFFILLTLVFYRLGLKNRTFFIPMGIALGLGLMTKYTAGIAAVLIGINALLFFRHVLREKKFWIGVAIAILIFSPVIVYNLMLFINFGHFDYALMNLIGPVPEVWSFNPGRDIGTVRERVLSFVPQMFWAGSWIIVLTTYMSLGYLFLRLLRHPRAVFTRHRFILTSYIPLILFVIMLGPAPRFLALLKPFFAMASAVVFSHFLSRQRRLAEITLSGIILLSIAYNGNTFLSPSPVGEKYLTFSPVHYNQPDLGYTALDNYFRNEFESRIPALTRKQQHEFLDAIASRWVQEKLQQDFSFYPAIIIYDPVMEPMATLFVLGRRFTYRGWPVMSVERFIDMQKNKAAVPNGTVFYYVGLNPRAYIRTRFMKPYTDLGQKLEERLQELEIPQQVIVDQSGTPSFHIYKWESSLRILLDPGYYFRALSSQESNPGI